MDQLLCGIDIGGTKLAAGLVTPDGVVRHFNTTNAHADTDEAGVMDIVAQQVRSLCDKAGIAVTDLPGVSVGMAGHMRSRDGVVLTTSNLNGFKQYPLTRELEARLGIPAFLENDANCQAWAEHKYGAGRGFDDMIFITVSTGIGAGLVINNRLIRGMTGTAGEIGHTIAEPGSDLTCTCGNRGCFMALASTINLDALARRKSQRFTATRILSEPDGDAENQPQTTDEKKDKNSSTTRRIDGRHVYAHAVKGDPVAMEIINEYADYLGIMVYNVFQIFNPPIIVLGGGLMNWELGYFERIRGKFHSLARDMLYDPIEIVKASVGSESGVIGAASLLLEHS
ncbi:MAG: ROK family protein [Planctomycetes bacterium]|nr:ROK family protein [Planctomycetota bacterium]